MPYPQGISHSQVVEALRSSRTFYPNADAIAYFRPSSLTLHFEKMSRETYAAISQSPASSANRQHIEVMMHELTHWSDQVSTVWGQEYLVKVFDAHAAAQGREESQFYKAIVLFDEERRILLPLYYHVVEKNTRPHSVRMPWRIEFSCGQEFGPDGRIDPSRPLFFVKFADNETGEPVARQPITVGSLLETTATWSELRAGIGMLLSISEGERAVEQTLWTRERMSMLYEPQLTVYTAPAHMLARFLGATDILQVYERAAIIAHVALNLTSNHFELLRHPVAFAPFGERLGAFARAHNRGYAFAAMARHATDVKFDQPLIAWLAEILDRSGLPRHDNIMQAAFQRLDTLSRGLQVRSDLDRARDYIFEIGRERLANRLQTAFNGNKFDVLGQIGPNPPMFDCNANTFSIGMEVLDPSRFDLN